MFVIVRHGNTFAAGETPRRIGARTNLPLTEAGVAQARALGLHFSALGWQFEKAFASPLLRTRQTAEAILGAQPQPAELEIADFLREVDHGPDEDKTEDAVIARVGPDAIAAWDAHAVPPPGWSVNADQRIAAWKHLFSARPACEGPTLLLTSNGAARFALLADPALQPRLASLPTLKLPTGSYGVIRRSTDGTLDIAVWGQRP